MPRAGTRVVATFHARPGKEAELLEILTGLIYLDKDSRELHEVLDTSQRPLNELSESELCPGSKVLQNINASLR